MILERMEQDTATFKEEVRRDQHNLEQNLERVQRETQEDLQEYKVTSNKRWGEFANRLGTIDLLNFEAIQKKEIT